MNYIIKAYYIFVYKNMIVKSRNVREIFDSLVGDWNIKRILNEELIAEGVATFKLIDVDNILYREDLEITYPHISCINRTYKEYLYFYHRGKNMIYKAFMDSTYFYGLEFDCDKSIAKGVHSCNQDYYKATYQILALDYFIVKYEVIGPKKSYIINTKFTRFAEI
jgi:hypothetical protein